MFKTEAIGTGSPFRSAPPTVDDVEYATMEWVDWYSNRRLHSVLDYIPPEEYQTLYYAHLRHGALPAGGNETMFLSQLPYVPVGDLRTVVSHPHRSGDIPDETLCAAVESVALTRYTDRLDEVNGSAKVLSPGEQQRIAFARILLTKPKVVFLDEATSAFDEPVEFMIYGLVRRRELPETVFVSVTHRNTVNRHPTSISNCSTTDDGDSAHR